MSLPYPLPTTCMLLKRQVNESISKEKLHLMQHSLVVVNQYIYIEDLQKNVTSRHICIYEYRKDTLIFINILFAIIVNKYVLETCKEM